MLNQVNLTSLGLRNPSGVLNHQENIQKMLLICFMNCIDNLQLKQGKETNLE